MATSNNIIAGVMIAVILICVAAIVCLAVTTQPSESFSEFYLLGKGGRAADYPSQAISGQPVSIIVGIVNHEGRPSDYTVQIRENDAIIKSITVGKLNDGQKWEQPVEFTLKQSGEGRRVNLFLFKDNAAAPCIKDPLVLIMKVTEN
ncbi:MAG: DUF1616 domain-containing protein [Dehalococcoidia bacterium]|nr:DUF1616 domain-containing protein [Dehalococcoidia bacterium]MDD5648183.1 DUF1616 domain-containing protein [Dehalococcoidia bacterium]